MEKVKEISVVKRLGSAIYETDTLQEFLDELSEYPEEKIRLDFSKVDFISMACAEIYLDFIEEGENKDKFKAVNFTPVVSTMIQQVKFRTRPEPEPKVEEEKEPKLEPEEEPEEEEKEPESKDNEEEKDPDEEDLTYEKDEDENNSEEEK